MSARHAAEPGYPAAVRATRERACALIDEKAHESDHAVAARVVRAIDVPGARFDEELAGDLERVLVAELERHGAPGARAVPLLVLADALVPHWTDRNIDVPVFADALTALVVACHRGSAALDGLQHVVHAVREFLAARRQPRDPTLALPRDLLLTDTGRRDWERLVEVVPWLRWWAPEDLDPRRAEPVGATALVDLLVLLRPCLEQRYAGDSAVDRPLPARFSQLYPSDVPVDPAALERLAEALGTALDQPSRAAAKLDGLGGGLPPALHAAAQARVQAELGAVTDLTNALVVRVDPGHVVVANLSTQSRLEQDIDGHEVVLQPRAIAERGAAGYCSEPLPVRDGTTLQAGRLKVALDVPMGPMAQTANFTSSTIPTDLFRGRERELAMLRMSMQSRGPRTGSLISGPRRAGKSTLMEHVSQDSRLRGRVSLDVTNTVAQVHDFAEWNRQVSRSLVRAVRRQLKGLRFEPEGVDLVETLIDLDDALDDGAPVAVALDELDVLLLPEQGSGGRHTANRLGNMEFRNLVVMGTVQRFHRSVHEFKNWQTVECPADLSWSDGVTYFFGPLHDPADGPRVEWLDRAGVTPRLFVDEIEPAIGLRPYFWGQLRGRLESVIRADPAQSRLAGVELVRSALALVVDGDAHLNHVLEDGSGLTPAERRRRDLLSVDERRILLRFASAERPGRTLSVTEAERIGGREAVAELLDRAYLTLDQAQGRLRIAVRVYEDFLRSRLSVLREVTPDAPAATVPATQERPAAPPRAKRPVTPPVTHVTKPPVTATTKPATTKPATTKPATTKPPTKAPTTPPPKATRSPSSPGTGSGPKPGTGSGPKPPRVGLTPPPRTEIPEPTSAELRRITAVLREEVNVRGPLPLGEAGKLINETVRRIGAANQWAGSGRLTDFVETHLIDFELDGDKANRVVRLVRGRRFRRLFDRL